MIGIKVYFNSYYFKKQIQTNYLSTIIKESVCFYIRAGSTAEFTAQ